MLIERYNEVKKHVEEACKRVGRDPREVTVIAVSKTKPLEMVEELRKEKVLDFGENKVQELVLAQQKLSASWEGAGKAAFDRAFQEDCMKMDLFRQTVEEYYQVLQQIIAGYEQAESRSIGIVQKGF